MVLLASSVSPLSADRQFRRQTLRVLASLIVSFDGTVLAVPLIDSAVVVESTFSAMRRLPEHLSWASLVGYPGIPYRSFGAGTI